MLKLKINDGDWVYIGSNIRFRLLDRKNVGIEAPEEIPILRENLIDQDTHLPRLVPAYDSLDQTPAAA